MDINEFKESLSQRNIPSSLTPLLRALWFDGAGQWEKAHQIAQEINTRDGSALHAYLHRKEGDLLNAEYWYRRAGRKMPSITIEKEWEELIREFL